MPAREAILAVKPMLKMPDNSVAKPHLVSGGIHRKQRVEQQIQRYHLSVTIDVIPYLPANAATGANNSHALIYDLPLEFEVVFNRQILFVLLPHVVRW